MPEGFIKLHRKINEWGWRHRPITFSVFIYILTKANHKETIFDGHKLPPGACIFGRRKAAETLGISEQSVRTAIKHLKSTNEITSKTTNKYTIIQVLNWEEYQGSTSTSTSHQPTTNQQLTTSKECKEGKEYKKNNKKKPDGVSETIWQDFVRHRKSKRAEITDTALDRIQRQASAAGWSLEDALAEIVMRGWVGFKADWVKERRGQADGWFL